MLNPRDELYAGFLERDDDGAAVVAHPYGGGRPPERLLWFIQSRGARMADPSEWEAITLADGTPARWWSPGDDAGQGHLRAAACCLSHSIRR